MRFSNKSKYFKSVSVNAVLNIIKQCCNIIIPLITYPYVSRVLGKENVGRFGFADSVVGIALIFAQLGIQSYAIREGARIRDDKDKISEFASEIYTINLASMLISCVILFLLTTFVPRLNRDFLLIAILSINIITNIIGRDWINSIYEDFLYITIRYLLFQIISAALIFVVVKSPEDCVFYTIIMMFANSGGYLLNFFYTRKYVPLRIKFCGGLKKHIKPILYLFGVALAIHIYVKSDIVILGFFKSDADVGLYTIASKVYTIIKAFLNAIVTVVIPRLASYLGCNDEIRYNKLLNKLLMALYAFVLPCVCGLFFESKNIMMFIGGNGYEEGANALRILCLALASAVFAAFYSQAVLITNRRDKYFFYATAVSATINILLNLVLIPLIGTEGAAITTVIAETVVVFMCRRFSKDYFEREGRTGIISVFVGCGLITIICIIVNLFGLLYYFELLLVIIFSIIAYSICLIAFKNEIAISIINNIWNRLFSKFFSGD